jgi:type IX secretion system PorP/SprF family membrane protein
MRTKFYAFALFMVAGLMAQAQDIHFSQYYASPLTLNPALTGKFDGFARVAGIYRGQYYGLSQSSSIFRTPALSVDFSLLKDKMNGNALGIGLSVVNDQQTSTAGDGSGTGKIGTTTIALDLGYTLNLNRKKSMQLSIGLEPSITMKNTNGSYEYPQAFNTNLQYDVTSPNHETFSSSAAKKMYFNFDYGLFFNHSPTEKITYFLGFSMKNVARPQTAIIDQGNANGKLNFLFVVHGGLEIVVAPKWTLIPGALYQNEAKANEANAGITVGYDVMDRNKNGERQKATIYLGLWNRMGNDVGSAFQYRNITPKIGFDYRRFRVDFAYDISMGNIAKDAKPVPGIYRPQAYELAISYIFGGPKKLKERDMLFNPRY